MPPDTYAAAREGHGLAIRPIRAVEPAGPARSCALPRGGRRHRFTQEWLRAALAEAVAHAYPVAFTPLQARENATAARLLDAGSVTTRELARALDDSPTRARAVLVRVGARVVGMGRLGPLWGWGE